MKNLEFKNLIKEEILKVLKEEEKKDSTEVVKLKTYLEGTGKSALKQVNNNEELKGLLNAVFDGMSDAMKTKSIVVKLKDLINSRLK
tara:strand:+ start:1000 stop:1260 length:261 start_codon:yes stop_codon:yes gene_type:complete